MSRQKTKTDDIRREHYFTKMIENAENALREYSAGTRRGTDPLRYRVYAAQKLSFGMTKNVCSRLKERRN